MKFKIWAILPLIFVCTFTSAKEYKCPLNIDLAESKVVIEEWKIFKDPHLSYVNPKEPKTGKFVGIEFNIGNYPLVALYNQIPDNDEFADKEGFILWSFSRKTDPTVFPYVSCSYEGSEMKLVHRITESITECKMPIINNIVSKVLVCK